MSVYRAVSGVSGAVSGLVSGAPSGGGGIAYASLADTALQTLARCEAAARTSRVPLVFSHLTALNLLGIEPPLNCTLDESLLHVAVRDRRRRRRRRGMGIHLWEPEYESRMIADSVECVDALTAWAQMSPYVTLGELVVLGDSLMRRDPRLRQCSSEDFARFLRTAGPFRGKASCVKALRFMMDGTDSSWETRVRLALRYFGLPEAIPNYAVFDEQLGFDLHIDLAYPDCKVGIEFQGDHHRTSKRQYAFDQRKKRNLEYQDWRIIPVVAGDLASERLCRELAVIVAAALGRRLPERPVARYRGLVLF
ncbi:hypothetical protein [Bifidobacterium margollesii]|nr:hypothetical protein [Bifidobacterium margollesii]